MIDLEAPGQGWACNRKPRLLQVSELPNWYEPISPFIKTGYRPPGLSACACTSTLITIHNETGNIWTHLLGGLIWIWICVRSLQSNDLAVRSDGFTFALHLSSYCLCGLMPLASTLAHLFHCRSARVYKLCWDMDHVGILALWFARALCEGYVLLWCHQSIFTMWTILCLFVFPVAGWSMIATGSTRLFLPLYVFIHTPLFILAVLDDALWLRGPADSLLSLEGSGLGDALRDGVGLTLMGSLCGVLGYGLMVAKLPESLAPGKFDLWFHSHQWWHVLTMLGPVLCLEAGRLFLRARLDFECPSSKKGTLS